MTHSRRKFFALTAAGLAARPSARAASALSEEAIVKLIEPIRVKHNLPALGGAIVTSAGLQARGICGVRKAGADIKATTADLWHLGSCTKAMTGTLAGIAVATGKLKWESTLAEVFPKERALKKSPFASASLLHLLTHRAGLPANLSWDELSSAARGDLRKQRAAALEQTAELEPTSPLGTAFLYSNLGYVLAGHMIEEALNDSWEKLMRERLFKPLGMTDAGFGGTGTVGKIDQPWPHEKDGQPVETNGPDMDNAAVIGPAGTVHASLAGWAAFAADQIAGANGQGRLLKAEMYRHLHTPAFGGTYAGGWGVAEREWGGGAVLTHAGSNTMNKCVAWLAPRKNFGVLVVTNQGGDTTTKACDEAAAALIGAWNEA